MLLQPLRALSIKPSAGLHLRKLAGRSRGARKVVLVWMMVMRPAHSDGSRSSMAMVAAPALQSCLTGMMAL